MDNDDSMPNSATESKPQVFKPEKKEGRWTFSRKDFLKLAVATAVAALLPRAKDVLGSRVQLIAQATEMAESGLQAGQKLTKVWYFKNNATEPWGKGAVLRLEGASEWQAASLIPLPNLAPGEVTSVRVSMVAPAGLDPRPVEATVDLIDEPVKMFLPIIHKAPEEPPCTCESYTPPCSCDSYTCSAYTPPCPCDYHIPCTCDYEVPCVCDTYYCPCDYEVPCICDYLPPCTCDYDICSCVGYTCPCFSYHPCSCDIYFPCSCDYFF